MPKASGVSPKWVKSNERRKKREKRRKKERKSVITMVSTCTPEPKEEERAKVNDYNGPY